MTKIHQSLPHKEDREPGISLKTLTVVRSLIKVNITVKWSEATMHPTEPHCLLLGCVALGAQRPIVIKLSRGRSVGRSVCRFVCPVHRGKTADRIRMPFGIVGRTGPVMRQVVEFGDRSTGKGTLGGSEFEARHCPQGPLRRTCATAPRPDPLVKLLWADLLRNIYSLKDAFILT